MGFYRQELDRQAQNRYEMAIDEDYYDNIQWDDESAAILRHASHAPCHKASHHDHAYSPTMAQREIYYDGTVI